MMDPAGRREQQYVLVGGTEKDFRALGVLFSRISKGDRALEWATHSAGAQSMVFEEACQAVLVGGELVDCPAMVWVAWAAAQNQCPPLILLVEPGQAAVGVMGMQAGAALYLQKDQVSPAVLAAALQYAGQVKANRLKQGQNEAYFRALVEEAPVLNWITDASPRLVYVNRPCAEFFGIDPAQITGGDWRPELHPEEKDIHTTWFLECAHQRQPYHAELRVRRHDGVWRYLLAQAQPRFSATGEFLGMAGSSIDITEKKTMEKLVAEYTLQLQNSNRELEQFAYRASHDLKEPLRKITMFSRLLGEKTGPALGETERGYLVRIKDAAARMSAMVDALLALSRVTTQGQPFTQVDLNQVLKNVLDDTAIRISKTKALVEVDRLPEVDADPVQMHQLFQNLLVNALKFHPPGQPPRVHIWQVGARNGAVVEIAVRDQGIGIDMKKASSLFQPFVRLVERAQYEGSGIGLSLCKRVVERHGGSIRVESRLGKGSTFFVTLPRTH